MASTTLQLVDRVRRNILNSGDRETFTDLEIISEGLNPTAREVVAVALAASKSETITTVAGTREYSVPAAISPFIRNAAMTYGASRKRLLWREHAENVTDTSSGEPQWWSFWNNKLEFAPTPSASGQTIYVDAYGGPAPAVEQSPAASTDEFDFARDEEDALVFGASSVMAAIDREPEREQTFFQRYQSKLQQIRMKLAPDNDVPASIDDGFQEDAFFTFI